MTGDRHDEIAARLREEAAARAPERLRADVMLRVRAEPRPRRIRPRRTYWRPLGSLAAAACVLAALVFAVSHVTISGSGSGSAGGGAGSAAGNALERAAASVPNALGQFPAGPTRADHVQATSTQPLKLSDFNGNRALYRAVQAAPRPVRGAVLGRAQLALPFRRALGMLDLNRVRGSH